MERGKKYTEWKKGGQIYLNLKKNNSKCFIRKSLILISVAFFFFFPRCHSQTFIQPLLVIDGKAAVKNLLRVRNGEVSFAGGLFLHTAC